MPNPNPKKKDLIAKRRQLIAKYRVAGMNQDQIKEILETKHGIVINRSTVSTDLKALRKTWTEEAKADINGIQAEAMIKLDQLELEAWSLFNKAKKDGKAGGNSSGYWHSQLLKTIEQRSKLLGLNKPDKLEVDSKGQVIVYLPQKDPAPE